MENPFLHYVDDFEKEAEAFLEKYACADAIENPRRIPILDIATRLMSLDVIQTESLSPDESVQGASVGLITPWRMNVITGGGTETILTSKEFTNRALNLASVAISICGKMSKRVGGLTLSEWSGRRVQLLLKF